MCQCTTQPKQLTAKTDKTVFKVVVFMDSQAFTPYTKTPISEEVLNGKKMFKANGRTKKKLDSIGWLVGEGNIHTFATAEEAFKDTNYAKTFGLPAVYECIIPKGTKYYAGFLYANIHTYASKQIHFVKRLKNPYEPKPTQTELVLR